MTDAPVPRTRTQRRHDRARRRARWLGIHAASCARKTAGGGAYLSEGAARVALAVAQRRQFRPGSGVYECLACGLWHITSHVFRRLSP